MDGEREKSAPRARGQAYSLYFSAGRLVNTTDNVFFLFLVFLFFPAILPFYVLFFGSGRVSIQSGFKELLSQKPQTS